MAKIKHKKKTYRKEPPKETLVVRDILKEERVAFLDTEYITSQKKSGPPARLVSIGFVICGRDFEEAERYHSHIYTEDEPHDKFMEITGITSGDLKKAPEYEQVLDEVNRKMEAWDVKHVFVWGPDKVVVQRDLMAYRKDISKKARKNANRILRMMKDIEGIYSRKLQLRSIGIANLKYLCDLGNEVSHDALDDAIDLKNVIRHMDVNGCPKYMVQAMRSYLMDKELYCRYRRFHEKWDHLSDGFLEKCRAMLDELEHAESMEMEAKALQDDIQAISTGEDRAFPSLDEYMKEYVI